MGIPEGGISALPGGPPPRLWRFREEARLTKTLTLTASPFPGRKTVRAGGGGSFCGSREREANESWERVSGAAGLRGGKSGSAHRS